MFADSFFLFFLSLFLCAASAITPQQSKSFVEKSILAKCHSLHIAEIHTWIVIRKSFRRPLAYPSSDKFASINSYTKICYQISILPLGDVASLNTGKLIGLAAFYFRVAVVACATVWRSLTEVNRYSSNFRFYYDWNRFSHRGADLVVDLPLRISYETSFLATIVIILIRFFLLCIIVIIIIIINFFQLKEPQFLSEARYGFFVIIGRGRYDLFTLPLTFLFFWSCLSHQHSTTLPLKL